MRTTLIDQIIKRREDLRIKSSDMPLQAGINRQQYEKIEKGGNPSLSTLDKIAEGLDSEVILVPKDKLEAVKRILNDKNSAFVSNSPTPSSTGAWQAIKNMNANPPIDFEANEDSGDPWLLIESQSKDKS